MDEKDVKILAALKNNARLSSQELARKIGLPITTTYNRTKKLEKEGVIQRYTIQVDKKKVGKGLTVYIFAQYNLEKLGSNQRAGQDIVALLKKQKEIEEIAFITGDYDIIIKVNVADIAELNEYIVTHILKLPWIARTKTMVVLEEFLPMPSAY